MGRDVGEELTGILARKTKDLVEEKKCELQSLDETENGETTVEDEGGEAILFFFTSLEKTSIFSILRAFVPASMIVVLYYFDHSVASQLAQEKEFNLKKPPSYHYDPPFGFSGDTILRC
ncbi:hypothetical protein GOBAR_DD24967 [Gossypium barbadense]|nr:hypothetical protein GOBAR_DD24967 [Gossypium barbadense]